MRELGVVWNLEGDYKAFNVLVSNPELRRDFGCLAGVSKKVRSFLLFWGFLKVLY